MTKSKDCVTGENSIKTNRLAMISMKRAIPQTFAQEEQNEYTDLVNDFNSKYPT